MQYRPYGKLGYNVSLLGMGCMRLPRVSPSSSEVNREKAYEIIRYAAQNGVNYFDTAFSYHHQASEEILGEALAGGLREKVKIATKLPFHAMPNPAEMRRNLENTLRKLRTDYLDIYLIHNIQKDSWEAIKQRQIIAEYEKYQKEGLIRAIGFSYHGEYPTFAEILAYYDWDMCQVQQNLLDADKEVTEQAIYAAGAKGTAIVIMEPLRGGGLTNAPPSVQHVYDQAPVQRPPVEWAFRHLINYPAISCILSGMGSLEQVKQNIAIFSAADALPNCLSTAEQATLNQAKAAYEALAVIPCTGCEYCLPCPANVAIPEIFSQYNAGTMFQAFAQPQRYYYLLGRAQADAGQCQDCGICESKCPQHLKIRELLQTAHQALDGWVE